MKKYTYPILPVILFGIMAALLSCSEEDEPLTAYGDAFITTINKNDTVYYGLYIYAYSWAKMKEVNVSLNNKPFQITLDTLNYRYTHAHIPPYGSFTATPPDSGTYIFDVLFDNGEGYTSTDFLDTTKIFPPVITEANFDTTNQKVTIKWESVCDDCGYRILLKDSNNNIAFQTELLNSDQSSLSITPYTYGWEINTQPYGGDKYKIIVMAFLFEPVASAFDLQCAAINDENEFTWE